MTDESCTCSNFRPTGLVINADAHYCMCGGYKTGMELMRDNFNFEKDYEEVTNRQRKRRLKAKFIQYRKLTKAASKQYAETLNGR